MAEITTNATVDGEKLSATVNYNIGESIDAAIKEYGEEAVLGLYTRGATLAVQQKVGALLRAGADVDANLASWRLDQRGTRVKKSKEEKVGALLQDMSADQIQDMLNNMGIKGK